MTVALLPAGVTFLPGILDRRARAPGDRWSHVFLDSKGREQTRWTAGDLVARTRAVAARLVRDTAPGEPVLLVFQPGADFLAAFMACLWSGRLATPINPPRRNRLIERLAAVAADSGATVALTSTGLAESVAEWCRDDARLGALDWIPIDPLADDPDLAPAAVDADDIAFIQYTSGSTALPKGVVVSHGNLIEDLTRMAAVWRIGPDATMVSWLPAFHDLGLIFGLLQPLFSGCASVQMAPNTFMQQPALWLSTVSKYRGTHSAAPSFAYDLCCRRTAPADRAGLDLGSLVMTMNAAEPINPAVLDRFAAMFRPHGFRREAFAPAYGLAESTLAVTASPVGEPPVVRCFDAVALGAGRASVPTAGAAAGRAMPGSGRPLAGVPVAIVDPETGRRCPPGRIGEIWVAGPTVARGYWRRPEETAETFGAVIEGEPAAGTFLRTGDLGVVVDGELFVTGRIKDLIILGGTNFHPHDIERVAQNAHAALRRDNGAAFAVADPESGREQVVLVQEVERTRRNDPPEPIFRAVVQAVWQDLELTVARIALVAPGSVLRTSSGKIQRLANRRAYLDGALPVIAEWAGGGRAGGGVPPEPGPGPSPAGPDAETVAAWLTRWLAERLELPVRDIGPERGFAELGLDSVGSTELAFALGGWIGADLAETVAFDHPTVARLAAHVSRPPASMPAQTVPTGDGTVSGGSAWDDLDELLTAVERGPR